MTKPTLASALSVFTSEFEKGSGGSHSLWPPGKPFAMGESWLAHRGFVQFVSTYVAIESDPITIRHVRDKSLGCYMVKPHGQLVLVS